MPIDTSIYQTLRPIENPSMDKAQESAMNLGNMAMRNKALSNQISQQEKDAAYQNHIRKASVFGGALESIAGLPPQQRAQEYANVRNSLIQDGIIKEQDAPAQYDDGFYRQSLTRYHQTKDYLDKQLAQAQISKMQQGGGQKNVFQQETEKRLAKGFTDTQEAGSKAQETIDQMDDALDSLVGYSKNSLGGTGPLASLGGLKSYVSKDAEILDRKFKDISLQTMKKIFSGMSKAIDSDAERRFFMASQPNLTNREETNASIILGAKSIALKSQAEAQAQKEYVDQNGNLNGYKSPIKGRMTTLVDTNGKMRLIPKSQVKQAKEMGFMGIDQYSKSLFKGGASYSPDAAYASDLPKSGSVVDGYRFKGGDPSSQSNWEKVK